MEPSEIKAAFKKRQFNQIIVAVIVIPIVIVLFIFEKNPDMIILGLNNDQIGMGGIGIVGAAVIYSFINWRCPNCNKYLGKQISPKNCSRCGASLK